jgi:hypothetical protein
MRLASRAQLGLRQSPRNFSRDRAVAAASLARLGPWMRARTFLAPETRGVLPPARCVAIMESPSTARRSALLPLVTLLALPGCFAFGQRNHDIDHTPIVNAGAGATILMPGQQAPIYHPGGQSSGPSGGYLSYPQAGTAAVPSGSVPIAAPVWPSGGSTSGSQSGSGLGGPSTYHSSSQPGSPAAGAPSGSVTFIGGAESNEVEHLTYNEEPSWFKYAMLPFAVVAAPFGYAAEKLAGDPQPGPEVPRSITPVPRGPAPPPVQELPGRSAPAPQAQLSPTSYDAQRLAELDRELSAPARQSPGGAPARSAAIAAELAALRSRGAHAPTAPRATSEPSSVVAPPLPTQARSASAALQPHAAEGRVDRNGDGRPDQWLERSGNGLARELRDDDFDGRAELSVDYDPATGEVRLVEEDQNGDGAPDTWTDYRGGRPLAQRRDSDFDQRVDTWTSYSGGEITRIERDTNADGSPDRVAYYSAGRLVREEIDQDRDGRFDQTLRYDDEQRLATREEDTDGDGQIDVISHYEGGRLVRRELATESRVQGSAPQS